MVSQPTRSTATLLTTLTHSTQQRMVLANRCCSTSPQLLHLCASRPRASPSLPIRRGTGRGRCLLFKRPIRRVLAKRRPCASPSLPIQRGHVLYLPLRKNLRHLLAVPPPPLASPSLPIRRGHARRPPPRIPRTLRRLLQQRLPRQSV